MDYNSVFEAIKRASKGMNYTSETDAPLIPFCWDTPDFTNESVRSLVGIDENAPLKVLRLREDFFDPCEKDPLEPDVEAWKQLRALFENHFMKEVRVLRFGEINVTYVVVGRYLDQLVGFKTIAVET